MTADNRNAEPVDITVNRLYREEADSVRRELERVDRWRQNLRVFLNDVAHRSGIYADHDGPTADWRFWHRTFREALAAERLAEIHAEQGEREVLERARHVAGNESRWAEPFALLTGHVPDPDALVNALLAANRDLGLRAIATAPRLQNETVRHALAITEDRDQRAAVYRRIPELLGEGDRSLRLLGRLRRQTRDGDDLFFLHLAVEETGRRFREVERTAQALLARFFDHIESPMDRGFDCVMTCEGEVPLWRPIPAGTFLMGAVGGGYADERPRHEVEIERPFRIAVVPMTNRQYAAFDPAHPWESWHGVDQEALADQPVVNVSWHAAVSFCRWLGQAFPAAAAARLPTEEEWEYACRAGTSTPYFSGGDEGDLARVGWYSGNSGRRTHPVGQLPPNDWKLHDFHGQVWEWTASRWRRDYRSEPEGPEFDPGGLRVIRGGSCAVMAVNCRSGRRDRMRPSDQNARSLASASCSSPSAQIEQ
jgi:formylglycine-generating enzyme required for sulfatase activity